MFSPLPNRHSLVGSSALSVAAHAWWWRLILFSLRLGIRSGLQFAGYGSGHARGAHLLARPGACARRRIRKQGQAPGAFRAGNCPPHPSWPLRRTPSISRRCHTLRLLKPLLRPMFPPPPRRFPTRAAAPTPGARARYRSLSPPTPPAPSPTFPRFPMAFRAT